MFLRYLVGFILIFISPKEKKHLKVMGYCLEYDIISIYDGAIITLALTGAIVGHLIRRDYENMGGEWPRFFVPSTAPKLYNEYKILCKKNNKKPILFYALFLVFTLFILSIIASIMFGQ